MTSEQQNSTSAEMPEGIPPQQQGSPGQGQSKSSRRRRRKRNKSKTGAAAGAPQSAEQGEGGVAAMQAAGEPSQNGNGASAGNGNGSGGATKRWKKKKFRSGGGSGNPNPGNQMSSPGNGNGGGRQQRRGKQKGPRSFVGPMDHSYRDGIGNYADAPPSTIEIHGNHGSNGHQRSHARNNNGDDSQRNFNLGTREAVPQLSDDAATKIYCFIDDLFFLAKIQETARKLGVKVAFVKNEKESLATLTDAEEQDQPALIVFDLNNANAKPLTLIPKLKTKFKKTASIVGFLSHLQGDLKAKAVEAGCDSVMPRSAFSQNLPNLLRRYGIQDEEEPNFNA